MCAYVPSLLSCLVVEDAEWSCITLLQTDVMVLEISDLVTCHTRASLVGREEGMKEGRKESRKEGRKKGRKEVERQRSE